MNNFCASCERAELGRVAGCYVTAENRASRPESDAEPQNLRRCTKRLHFWQITDSAYGCAKSRFILAAAGGMHSNLKESLGKDPRTDGSVQSGGLHGSAV